MDRTMRKSYHLFFYASICHICKKTSSNRPLKRCSGCKMIVYCNRKHQKEHWKQHKDLCTAIQYVRKTCAIELSAYQGTPQLMKFLREEVQQILQRTLILSETQMFLYPRMCLVCYKETGELQCCPQCMSVWYCAQHKSNHDISTCDLLKLCFETSMSLYEEKALSYVTDAYLRVTSYEKEFSDMKEFINIYGDVKGIQSKTSPHMLEIKQSIRLTRALTVFFGMCVLDDISTYEEKTELVLHIIAAYKTEIHTLREWEILLHIFPNLLCLTLVLIVPEDVIVEKPTVCDYCVRSKKSFVTEVKDMSYLMYVHMCPTFKKPDLVVRFYNNILDYLLLQNIWIPSLQTIAQLNCPLLLSHPYQDVILHDIINIVFGRTIEFSMYDNPFASLKPNRVKFEGNPKDYAFYENKYLTVYKTLCP